MQVIAPPELLELALSWEFEDLFACLKVGDNGPVVLTTTDDQAWVGKAPREGKDTLVVNIVEGAARIVGLTQIPNVDCWVGVIIVGHYELSWVKRIPHHLCFFELYVLIWLLVLSSKVVVHSSRAR